jgi:hypothetical protein
LVVLPGCAGETPTHPALDEHAFGVARVDGRRAPIAKRFPLTAGGCGISPQPPVAATNNHDPEGVSVGTSSSFDPATALYAMAAG